MASVRITTMWIKLKKSGEDVKNWRKRKSETLGPTLRPVTLIQFYRRPSVNGAENVQVSAVSKMDFTSHYSQSQIDQSHHPKKDKSYSPIATIITFPTKNASCPLYDTVTLFKNSYCSTLTDKPIKSIRYSSPDDSFCMTHARFITHVQTIFFDSKFYYALINL